MSDSIARRVYYAIGEVCDVTGLRPHVLRYWETQFEDLRPTKNRAGNRVYRPRDVELILLVKHLLYRERFTIEGARRKLAEMKEQGRLEGEGERVLEPELVQGMRWELDRLRELLSLPGSPPVGEGSPGEEGRREADPREASSPHREEEGNEPQP